MKMSAIRRFLHLKAPIANVKLLPFSQSFRFLSSEAIEMANCIKSKFTKDGVIPDVLDAAPPRPANITYPSGAIVNLGAEITPTQAKYIPFVSWKADCNAFHTVIMVDPDAPSRKEPNVGQWLHWLVTNIPGCYVEDGDTLTEYVGAGPPKDTGLHRYVILVYLQPCKMVFYGEPCISCKCTKGRTCFSLKKFVEKHKLVGTPVAGNFFQAKWDNYVPLLYKQLGAA